MSRYGARKGGAYYFYNVLDELDAPGEWYLDRETGMLYFYPPRDLRDARVEMTITTKSVLHLKNAHDLTFEGFTFRGTRGDAVTIEGDRNVLRPVRDFRRNGQRRGRERPRPIWSARAKSPTWAAAAFVWTAATAKR